MKKLLMLSTLVLALPGCFNTNQVSQPVSSSRTPSSTTASSTVGPAFTIISQSVTYPAAGAAATDLPTQILNFNAVAAGTQTLVDVCQVPGAGASSSRACKCRYNWSETNLTDASVIARTVDTALTQVTTFQVQCEVPTVYTTEISDGTILKVSVVPDTVAGNVSGFTTNVFSYTKTSSAATGDFRDVEGRTYKNIFHYVCYDKFQRALSIDHAEGVAATNNATGASVYA